MPALPSVPGVIKLRMINTIFADPNNGWHLYVNYGATPPTQTQANTLASATAAAWLAQLAPMHNANTVLSEVTATDLGSSTAPVGIWTGSDVGTRVGAYLPASNCVLMNMLIKRRYRGGKPRAYIPAGVESDLANGHNWSTTFQTAFTTAWGNFLGAILTSVNSWSSGSYICSVSYYAGHEWKQDQNDNWHRVPLVRAIPLVDQNMGWTMALKVGTQRRRLTV